VRRAARIAALYALVAVAWIWYSDRALEALVSDPAARLQWGVWKGVAFVGVTALLLFALMVRAFGALDGTVRRLRLQEAELARFNRLYAALSQVNQAIVMSTSRDLLFPRVCEALVQHGGFRIAWIGVPSDPPGLLVPAAVAGDHLGYLSTVRVSPDDVPMGRGPSGTAFREGRTVVDNDLMASPPDLPWYAPARRSGLGAAASMPVREGGRVVGILSLYAGEAGYFREREIALLEEAATDLSFALDNFVREAERRRAQAAVAAEQRFSQALVDSVPGVLYLYDDELRFLRWNRSFEVTSGYTAEEIARMKPGDFFPPEDAARVGDRIELVFASGEASVEARLRARDGTLTPHLFTGRRVEVDGRPCLVGVGIDISERVRVEAALRESEERMRQLAENINEVFWLTDVTKAVMLYVSPAYERIWGRSRRELHEHPASWMDAVHPDDRERVVAAAQRQQEGTYDETYRIVRPDGSQRWVRDRAFPVRDAQGAVQRLVGTAVDVTDYLALQAQLDRARRLESIGQLTGGMAHDFNNLLTVILGNAEVLATRLGPGHALEPMARLVVEAAERGAALTQQLLAFARRQPLRPQVVDVNEVARSVVSLVAPMLGGRITCRLSVAPAPALARVDSVQLDNAVLNLCLNARDAMPEGGTLVVSTCVRRLEAGESGVGGPLTPGDYVELAVEDEGTGIVDEHMDRLFEPFFTTKGPGRGTGLGLPMVYGFVRQSGGDVRVWSRPGEGTRFALLLPGVPAPAAA